MKKKGYSLLSVIIIIVITSIASGLAIGTILTKNSFLFMDGTSIGDDKNLKDFLAVYNKIRTDYYESVDDKTLIDGAISGMLNEIGDSYTTLLNEDSASDLLQTLNGTYKGIGITITDQEVINTVVNSPAEKSGILPGDIIKSVNGVDVSNYKAGDISDLIADSPDKVTLVILRDNQEYTFNLEADVLDVPAVSYNVIDNTNIGYIKVSVFSKTVTKEMESALTNLKIQGINGLIIDLRGNNGGYLDGAKNSASLFIEKNKVIYSLSTKNGNTKYIDEDNTSETMPVVVLINKGTASSAEVLTAALKDSYNATIVGETSYGKGKVQYTYALSDGSIAKYTSSKWLRPNGECIDEVGITPDYMITNEYIFDQNNNTVVVGIIDNQLQTAVKLLSN